MKFRSTRKGGGQFSLTEAIEKGLASDGGLFVPVAFPKSERAQKRGLDRLGAFAADVLRPFFEGEELKKNLDEICERAFSFEAPLRKITGHLHSLELFHGPTAAFKDFGARFLAAILAARGSRAVVLVATSGDTGGAVAAAFDGLEGLDVVVLFPENGVSRRQRRQLTCWGGNIHSYAVQGTFDDCQSLVKKAFASWNGRRPLTSANSINIGRLLPQTVYYADASLTYESDTDFDAEFFIPTGNLGNAQAAIWARELGFPVGGIHLVCNANATLGDYFETGEWKPRPSVATLANAMDVGSPSNMERLFDLYPNPRDEKHDLTAATVSDEQIREAIKSAWREWKWIVCPHTATAVHEVKRRHAPAAVVVATAHPAKFETIVEPLIGRPVELPPSLAAIETRPEKFTVLPVDLDLLLAEIRKIC